MTPKTATFAELLALVGLIHGPESARALLELASSDRELAEALAREALDPDFVAEKRLVKRSERLNET